MTTRAQIDEAVARYAGVDRMDVPVRYRDPQNEHDFNIGIAIVLATEPQFRGAGPAYDDEGNLTGWVGVRFKGRGQ